MQSDSPGDARAPRSRVAEIIVAIALLAASLAMFWHGVVLVNYGDAWFRVCEFAGIGVIMLGACFDPVNAIALCIPWVFSEIADSPPYRKVGLVIIGFGWLILLAGLFGGYWSR